MYITINCEERFGMKDNLFIKAKNVDGYMFERNIETACVNMSRKCEMKTNLFSYYLLVFMIIYSIGMIIFSLCLPFLLRRENSFT